MLAHLCVYTIKHSSDLDACIEKGGSGTFSEHKTWARASGLLDQASRDGKRLPIVFAPAEGTRHLYAWAIVEAVTPGKTSTYSFTGLRRFDSQRLESSLRKATDGERLPESFIKPYAICTTPRYLKEQRSPLDHGTARPEPRFWLCHWQFQHWRPDATRDNEPIRSSGSNRFRKKGVAAGDFAYIVSLDDGQLYLGGRMPVKKIVSRREAVRLFGNPGLFDVSEWIVDPDESGTPLHLNRRLTPEVARQLRCVSPNGEPKGLRFDPRDRLNSQTTRGLRELTRESALLLDRIIENTDSLPRTDKVTIVTPSLASPRPIPINPGGLLLPGEFPVDATYREGTVTQVLVNRYERDRRARDACIAHFGAKCGICKFDFGVRFGEEFSGFIHVHHLRPLSEIGEECELDAISDLLPVCPNCHAVIHHGGCIRTIEEVKKLLARAVTVTGENP